MLTFFLQLDHMISPKIPLTCINYPSLHIRTIVSLAILILPLIFRYLNNYDFSTQHFWCCTILDMPFSNHYTFDNNVIKFIQIHLCHRVKERVKKKSGTQTLPPLLLQYLLHSRLVFLKSSLLPSRSFTNINIFLSPHSGSRKSIIFLSTLT